MADQKTIVYGIMGEGLGHAKRSQAVIQQLIVAGHRVHVLTSADALATFHDHPDLHYVPPLSFVYRAEKIALGRTILRHLPTAFEILTGVGRSYGRVEGLIRELQPDCVITDFEPYTAYVGRRLGIPVIAIDHQRALTGTRLPQLDLASNVAIWVSNRLIRYLFRVDRTVVSSFYHFESRSTNDQYRVYNIFRSEVTNLPAPSMGEHVTVYLKRSHYWPRLQYILAALPEQRFQIFSDFAEADLESVPASNIELHDLDSAAFVTSLKQCRALFSTAGNQAIGEALYFGKPILVMPEPNAFEQKMNGLALVRTGAGCSVPLTKLTENDVRRFLSNAMMYRQAAQEYVAARPDFNATQTVINIIDMVLRTR